MVCSKWNSENGFCSAKKMTIDPEELSFCSEDCRYYEPSKEPAKMLKSRTIICIYCGTEFLVKPSGKVEIKNREYDKCPECGSVNIRRDDAFLTK